MDKKSQREYYMEKRKNMDIALKEQYDLSIFEKVINSEEYKNCTQILTYFSVNFEVDTKKIIDHAFANGKEIYLPFVTKEKRVMKFYRLSSYMELTLSKFGVYGPKPIVDWVDNGKSLCIVPAIVFDDEGYRIGYGGGYYDYFLSNNDIKTIGIMYDDFIVDKVVIDQFDQKVEKIITDKRIIK